MRVRLLLLVLVSTFLLAQLGAAQSKAPETSCTACHRDADLFDPEQLEVVTDVQRGVHAQVNLVVSRLPWRQPGSAAGRGHGRRHGSDLRRESLPRCP